MLQRSVFFILLVLISAAPSLHSIETAEEPAKNLPSAASDFEKLANEPGTVLFTPPKNWRIVDEKELLNHVRFMVVGQGKHPFPPSINLSTELFNGTLKEYLAIVKEINRSQGTEWKNLGTIRTDAGQASLSQADTRTEWGQVRLMHAILLKNGVIYILTAAALKKEFPSFYQAFFKSFKSLKINSLQETKSLS